MGPSGGSFDKTLDLEIVHFVVQVKGRHMAGGALSFTEKQHLPA